MPVEAKPLFRREVLRPHLLGFHPPGDDDAMREIIARWSGFLWSPHADTLKERELLQQSGRDKYLRPTQRSTLLPVRSQKVKAQKPDYSWLATKLESLRVTQPDGTPGFLSMLGGHPYLDIRNIVETYEDFDSDVSDIQRTDWFVMPFTQQPRTVKSLLSH